MDLDKLTPPHYTGNTLDIPTIDAIQNALTPQEFIGFLKGQILKYAHRMGRKHNEPAAKDAAKLLWFAQKLADTLQQQENV